MVLKIEMDLPRPLNDFRRSGTMDLAAVNAEQTGVTRIAGARLKALKAKTIYTTSWRFFLRRAIFKSINDVRASFEQLFVRMSYSCAKSGHVLPIRGWRAGTLPVCAHCKQRVKTLDDNSNNAAAE
jgi:hypothetical protein